MAYDAAKDQEIKTWKHENGLYVSLYQYNGGAPKVQRRDQGGGQRSHEEMIEPQGKPVAFGPLFYRR